MPERFSVRDVSYHITPDGLIVVITTDRPAHLWLRWTEFEPWTHRKPILLRGLYLHDDVRFCFVVFTDIEQAEPGDTLIHTFLIPTWAAGTPLWHYIAGQIDTQPSPSTSAILRVTSPTTWPNPPSPGFLHWQQFFTFVGALMERSVGRSFATTIEPSPFLRHLQSCGASSRNNDDVIIAIRLARSTPDGKPLPETLASTTINLQDGIEEGGDGADYRVYTQTATIDSPLLPNILYSLVWTTFTSEAVWWAKFRSRFWIGPQPFGLEHIHSCWDQNSLPGPWNSRHPAFVISRSSGLTFP